MIRKILLAIFQSLFSTLLLFFILEAGFRLAGFPSGAARYVERIVIQEKLSTRKPADEYRIFLYGESTMHGSHYAPVSNPARWLEVYLHDFLPGKKIKVVNFARMGQGSHFIYQSFRDTVAYKPDLAIFYYGHNAFLPGNKKYQIEAKERRPSVFYRNLMRQSHFLSAVYRWGIEWRVGSKKDAPGQDSIEYAVIETGPAGFAAEDSVLNTDPFYKENIAFFESKTAAILDLIEKKQVAALFYKPVGNLKDFFPNMSAHMKPLSAELLRQWERAFEKGKKTQAQGNSSEALQSYNEARAARRRKKGCDCPE